MVFVIHRTEYGWKRGDRIELPWCQTVQEARRELNYLGFWPIDGLLLVGG